MIILKLGGSVITNKTKIKTFKNKLMDSLSESIKKSGKQMIIVHGAGSFGHILAKKYELNDGYKNSGQIKGFSETHEMVQSLNTLVLKSLLKYDIPAVSIPPHSIVKLDNHKFAKMDCKLFADYLERKLIPVTFGDVVLDKKLGFSICSGDLLVEILAKYFKPEKVIFAIDEDGLYTSNPKIDKKAKLIEKTTFKKLKEFSTSLDKHADVTGGMGGKIDTIINISKLGIETVLLNGNKNERLFEVLVGKETKSTIISGE